MAGSIATAYVQVMPSMDGVAPAVKKHFTGAGKSAGHAFGGMFGTAMKVGLGAAAAGLSLTIKESLSEGAKLQQSLGGIETLFKGSAGDVIAAAEQAYRTAGLSANEYMETVTSFSASLISSLSGDTQRAAEVADMALVDMSDNANKMGSDMQSIQDAYQGFAKQNYTMLDNLKLGYGGTKSEMARLLADAQKLTGVEYDIGNLSDVYSAIHAIQGELGITGATAMEASTTLTGSFNSMKAAFKNVLGDLALGRPMEKSLNALAETTTTFLVDNFIPTVGNILKGLPRMISTLWGKLTDGNLGDWVSNLISSFSSYIDNNMEGALNAGGKLLYSIIDGIIEALPQLAETAVNVINKLGAYLSENSDELLAAAAELGAKAGEAIWESLVTVFEGLCRDTPLVVDAVFDLGTRFAGMLGTDGSHANGLSYVPYDGYIAELHQGEMVLTRAQANAVRSGRVGGDVIVNQYFYENHHTAADQMAAARYEQEKAVLGLV